MGGYELKLVADEVEEHMNIKILEVVFSPSASPRLDGAAPFFIDNLNPGWRELQAYAEIYRSGDYKTADLVGVFSPKFSIKAGISVDEFRKFVRKSPAGDVFFINPFPQIAYRSLNVWMQGELAHPGLVNLAKELLSVVGVHCPVEPDVRQGPDILCYCNFWAGTPKFWEEYVGGVLMPIVEFLEVEHDSGLVSHIMSDTAHTVPAPFIPFIVERLFTAFIQSRPSIVSKAWKHDMRDIIENFCLNDFERIMVQGMAEEIDLLDLEGSQAFSSRIRHRMWLNSMLAQQHHDDYYQFVPHPHSGVTLRGDLGETQQ